MAGARPPSHLAGAYAEMKAKRRRVAAEREEHRRIRLHLKEITEEGRDEHIWTVRLTVRRLPEHSGSLWDRICHARHRSPNQSEEDYLN